MAQIHPLFAKIVEHFMHNDVKIDLIDKVNQTLQITFPLSKGNMVSRVMLSADGRFLMLIGGILAGVSPDHRLAIAEAIARVNYVVQYGGFCCDFSDGEVIFRCTNLLSTKGAELDDLLMSMISGTVGTVERFAEALRDVSLGRRQPERVLS